MNPRGGCPSGDGNGGYLLHWQFESLMQVNPVRVWSHVYSVCVCVCVCGCAGIHVCVRARMCEPFLMILTQSYDWVMKKVLDGGGWGDIDGIRCNLRGEREREKERQMITKLIHLNSFLANLRHSLYHNRLLWCSYRAPLTLLSRFP